MIIAQVDKSKVFCRFDLSEPPCMNFVLLNREISEQTVAAVAKHGLQKAHFERIAQIEHTEPPCGVPPAWIAEPARRLSKTQRVGKGARIDPAETRPWRNDFEIERRMFETGRRLDTGHLAKVTAGDTFGCGNRIGVPTSLQGIESRATVKRPMWRD